MCLSPTSPDSASAVPAVPPATLPVCEIRDIVLRTPDPQFETGDLPSETGDSQSPEPLPAHALRLRVLGHSPDDIARQLALSPEEAQRLVAAELGRLEALQEPDETRLARRFELERLEALWRILMPMAAEGEMRAFMPALRVLERRLDCLKSEPASPRSATPSGGLPGGHPLASLSDEELETALRQLEE